jgi:hypothetical protein
MRRIQANHIVNIIDSKNELGPIFKKHCKIWKKEQLEEATSFLRDEIERRTILFAEAMEDFERPIGDLNDYTELTGNELPIITFVVEEWLVLNSMFDINVLNHLLLLGRSSGVYVFVLMQYINSREMPRKASTNFNHRVYLGRFDAVAAGIMFGTLEKEFRADAVKFLGPPGNVMMEINNSELSLATIPRISKNTLAEWM